MPSRYHHERLASPSENPAPAETLCNIAVALVGGRVAIQGGEVSLEFTPAQARELAFALWEAAKDAQRFERKEDCGG